MLIQRMQDQPLLLGVVGLGDDLVADLAALGVEAVDRRLAVGHPRPFLLRVGELRHAVKGQIGGVPLPRRLRVVGGELRAGRLGLGAGLRQRLARLRERAGARLGAQFAGGERRPVRGQLGRDDGHSLGHRAAAPPGVLMRGAGSRYDFRHQRIQFGYYGAVVG